MLIGINSDNILLDSIGHQTSGISFRNSMAAQENLAMHEVHEPMMMVRCEAWVTCKREGEVKNVKRSHQHSFC